MLGQEKAQTYLLQEKINKFDENQRTLKWNIQKNSKEIDNIKKYEQDFNDLKVRFQSKVKANNDKARQEIIRLKKQLKDMNDISVAIETPLNMTLNTPEYDELKNLLKKDQLIQQLTKEKENHQIKHDELKKS